MSRLFDLRFSLFALIDVIGLCLCSFILKRFIKSFPNKLIPLLNVICSLVTSYIYLKHNFENFPIHFYIITGVLNGLAAVGLHQLFKQTKEYIAITFKVKHFKKDERKIVN